MFSNNFTFDTIIIDEACQAVELSTLIPLRYLAKRVVLIGDPNQLPPTVLSKKASSFVYEQSLFTRIQNVCPSIVNLLSVQYRMHPSISSFPSRFFYNGHLKDNADNIKSTFRIWHRHPLFTPYLFFDVKGQENKRDDRKTMQQNRFLHSLSNLAEAEVIVGLLKLLASEFSFVPFAGKIGIISPYREQVRIIRRLLLKYIDSSILKYIEVNTVDGFQGQEKEIIIFSCVRAASDRSIGFLRDTRRLNVALTRAKCSLFIVGHSDVLSGFPIWDSLIKDAKDRKVFVPFANIDYWRSFFKIPSQNLMSFDANTESKSSPNQKEAPNTHSRTPSLRHSKSVEGSNSLSLQPSATQYTSLDSQKNSPLKLPKDGPFGQTDENKARQPVQIYSTANIMPQNQPDFFDSRPFSPPSDPRLR